MCLSARFKTKSDASHWGIIIAIEILCSVGSWRPTRRRTVGVTTIISKTIAEWLRSPVKKIKWLSVHECYCERCWPIWRCDGFTSDDDCRWPRIELFQVGQRNKRPPRRGHRIDTKMGINKASLPLTFLLIFSRFFRRSHNVEVAFESLSSVTNSVSEYHHMKHIHKMMPPFIRWGHIAAAQKQHRETIL